MPSSKRVLPFRPRKTSFVTSNKRGLRKASKLRQSSQSRAWLRTQVENRKAWASFSIPVDRMKYVYNLNQGSFTKLLETYHQGKSNDAVDTRGPGTPQNSSHIRQNILATILMFEFQLSHKDFIVMKRLATARNRGLSAPSDEETKKWPARPDVFEKCNDANVDGISDDEMICYLLDEKYVESSSESEDDDEQSVFSSHDEQLGPLRDSNSSTYSECALENVNNRTIGLLKHMYINFDAMYDAEKEIKKLGISRSKFYDCRNVLSALMKDKIPEASTALFEKTFEFDSLVKTPMMANKKETIKIVVRAYQQLKLDVHDNSCEESEF